MKRSLKVLLAVVIVELPGIVAEAQQPVKVHKIGLLLGGGLLPSSSNIDAFRQGLRDFGYLEGQKFRLSTAFRSAATGLRTWPLNWSTSRLMLLWRPQLGRPYRTKSN